MPCVPVRWFNGHEANGFVCTRSRYRPKVCDLCGVLADALCDWPMGNGKTCDAPLCAKHRVRQGENVDYCPRHARMARGREG